MASTEARRINPNYNDGGYPELVKTILGTKAEKLLTVLMIIYVTGSCIAYLNVMRDQAHAIIVQIDSNSSWAKPDPGCVFWTLPGFANHFLIACWNA
jgi:amino acid permease